jgi:aspartyl-tRNA(Asn)/glutamyl-tRNA(Gln) amidotransferase subunit C
MIIGYLADHLSHIDSLRTRAIPLKISTSIIAFNAVALIMSLALSDVKRLAILSRLELNDEQATQTLDKLNSIFALAEQMKAVDTAGITPLSHPIAMLTDELALRLRDDVVTEQNHRDDYQKPAPATQDGLYLVPKVIE